MVQAASVLITPVKINVVTFKATDDTGSRKENRRRSFTDEREEAEEDSRTNEERSEVLSTQFDRSDDMSIRRRQSLSGNDESNNPEETKNFPKQTFSDVVFTVYLQWELEQFKSCFNRDKELLREYNLMKESFRKRKMWLEIWVDQPKPFEQHRYKNLEEYRHFVALRRQIDESRDAYFEMKISKRWDLYRNFLGGRV
jgi:hypothetical protein